jgi:phospholipid/cholesterol/gamma-HCH transport system substrate-binding protein
MRRVLAIIAAVVAIGLMIALPGALGAGSGGTYEVRGIFDNGAFVVDGEEVRVAGATVGTVKEVDVSDDDEIVSREGGDHAVPGKAVVVMDITDDGFKDFRIDASCTIRPQSLIGERYIDCTPTEPRAPGEPPPPELERIADGEPGEGQRLLPLENNGTTVDLDLIQNIQRVPYRDRFRLILNDLGAGLAARGEELGDVIDRANPALRQTDRVLRILALQRRQLSSLAENGNRALEPLARNRTSITGFVRNAAVAADATAERGPDLEEALGKFPETLREVRLTMRELKEFADQGTPLFADLRISGKNISRATQRLAPLGREAVPALTTLGDAAEAAGPKIAASDPLLTDLANAAHAAVPVGNNLASLFDTFIKTGGFQSLADFIYNTSAATNGFDSFGHFLRINVQVTNCIDVSSFVVQGCEAFFQNAPAPATNKKNRKGRKARSSAQFRGGPVPEPAPQPPAAPPELPQPELPQLEWPPLELTPPADGGSGAPGSEPGPEPDSADPDADMQQAEALLRFLIGGSG